MTSTFNTSIYLSADDKRMLAELIQETGFSRSGVFRVALQRMYENGAAPDGLAARAEQRKDRLYRIADELREIA